MALLLLPLAFAAPARAAGEESGEGGTSSEKPPAVAGGGVSAQELANQVNNPAAPVTYFQFRNIVTPWISGTSGAADTLQVQPVIPIGPFDWLRVVQLVKITMPIVASVPGTPRQTGTGDMTLFDLLSFKQSWGRWGVGPVFVFPTASQPALGAGKYQVGPAVGAFYTAIPNLTAGAILQFPISFAGSSDRPPVAQLLVSPTLTYNFPDGWFGGLTDFNWTVDLRTGDATLPLGLQAGKVVRIGRLPVSVSAEAGRAVVRPPGTPNPGWIVGVTFTPIFNFHIGPGEKIKLRAPPKS
jgi:hypothetical protein